MRLAHLAILTAGLAALAAPVAAHAQDVVASAPFDVSVTVYRDPYRSEGGFNLNRLQGFALISETRRVVLPPGQHRLRFEGVADGIDAASAIVTGLPSGVIEKNRDAALLSPSALIASAESRGGRVMLARTNPGTGSITRREGTIRSGAGGGVVFETPDGVEALRCSGLPETFGFESSTTGLSSVPTLSVLTRTEQQVEVIVQLSYLARGFDWAADYVLDMDAGAGEFDLGAWITLANGNGIGFPNARVQIVAGRLNRDTGRVDPIELGQPILANCWPQGSTSDSSPPVWIEQAYPLGFGPEDGVDRVLVTGSRRESFAQDAALPVAVFAAAPSTPAPEDLGDLKLYRMPGQTTVASRQSKQVRLMDRAAVPVEKIYEVDISANQRPVGYVPMTILLRTRNDEKNNLGLPLPSGRVSVFEETGTGSAAQRLLSGQTGLRDTAVDEETEFRLGQSPDVQVRQIDVQVRQIDERVVITQSPFPSLPFLPGADSRGSLQQTNVIEIANARPFAIQAEVRLYLYDGQSVVKADRPAEQKNGRPIFRVTVPANDSLRIRYQTVIRR